MKKGERRSRAKSSAFIVKERPSRRQQSRRARLRCKTATGGGGGGGGGGCAEMREGEEASCSLNHLKNRGFGNCVITSWAGIIWRSSTKKLLERREKQTRGERTDGGLTSMGSRMVDGKEE